VATLVSAGRAKTESHPQENQAAMSLVPHKYTPAEMSDHELEATFAARTHTVDYLVKALRDQIHAGTLSSYVVTGPRGAGKSTIIQMVDLRIRQDAELSAAWTPIIFPEEQFNLISLRDLLAATLQALVKQNLPTASGWLDKVEAEPNEEQSEQLAITGLREITRSTGKRLILFIENLDHLLGENLDSRMKGTLRRLLMSDAFMLIIGSTVHLFDALKSYDEAFFNYFGQVPLDRLDADQVSELLRKRAEYDGNERFLRELPQQQAKVKTLVHLTGGNPRFVLMLYELLSLQQVTTIVQQLKRLVDELTPLLKDEMENLPPQQRKIIHALMERGGTAQPTDLTGPTRLPLNAITTQLKRLKDAQIVEVLGGGKGRAANYTVPDKLFSLWYQMRYLGQNRRRIELFVEMLRIWFEADERIETLRKLARSKSDAAPQALRDCAMTAEYLAASLKGSTHEQAAAEICIKHWIKTDLQEAAIVFTELLGETTTNISKSVPMDHLGLSEWLIRKGDFADAIKVSTEAVSKPNSDALHFARAFLLRGYAWSQLGEAERAIGDYSTAINHARGFVDLTAQALVNRGIAKRHLHDTRGAIDDYDAAIGLKAIPLALIAQAQLNRGAAKAHLGDLQATLSDCTDVMNNDGATKELRARALVNRGIAKLLLGDRAGALADFNGVITAGAPKKAVAKALTNRGAFKHEIGDVQGAMADYTAVIELEGAPKESVARAQFNRGLLRLKTDPPSTAFNDLLDVISAGETWNHLMSAAAAVAIVAGQVDDIVSRTEIVLQKFSAALTASTNANARDAALSFLNALATPESKEIWPNVWRSLFAKLKPEVAETIGFLEPVCRVLEGQDRTLLDALPPEQREFAVEVLAKFEPEETDASPKPEEVSCHPAKRRG
jgi:tetratricopeptide (TPR) repeat protein